MNIYKRIIGMTGGMGAGKSTLVKVIEQAGIPVFDVDETVHQLYENSQVADYIGSKIGLSPPVSRAMVAEQIVRFPEYLPIVEEDMMINLDYCLKGQLQFGKCDPFLVIDAPLLFEMGWASRCDMVIAIQCPREIREERVMKRPGMTAEKMKLLMDRQISEADRLVKSHYIIHNDKSVEEAQAKMAGIIAHLKEFYA